MNDWFSKLVSTDEGRLSTLLRLVAGLPLLTLQFALPAPALAEAAEPAAAIAHYDLEGKLGVQGYDPVAYFELESAVEGKKSISAQHNGVEYRFASEASRARFQSDPERYRPAYGGWCAWAMASGGKTSPDPENFIVTDGRLFLFYKNFFVDTKTRWQAGNHATLETRANAEWAGLIGAKGE